MASRTAIVKWLLDSDPSIRWQVMRDLTDADEKAVAIERARVTTEGWGARLLGYQSPRGYWGGRDDPGWMTTVWCLALLKEFGRMSRQMAERRFDIHKANQHSMRTLGYD